VKVGCWFRVTVSYYQPMSESPKVCVRVPDAVADHLDDVAHWTGRGRSEEVRIAISLHNLRATLAWLNTPEATAEVGEVAKARAEVKADLAKLEATAYGLPPVKRHTLYRMNLN
jgi:predicted transcriptional regulator